MHPKSSFAVVLTSLIAVLGCSGGTSEAEYLAKAQALLARKDSSGALIELKNAISKHPKSGPARLQLGRLLLANGDPQAALIELRRAEEALVPEDQVLPDIARALLASGQWDKLVSQHAQSNLSDKDAQADFKTSLAAAYSLQGKTDLARAAAEAALQARPSHALATVQLARLAAAAGDSADALHKLDEVLLREPGHVEAGLLRAQVLLRSKNEPSAAIAAFGQVRDAHPDSIAAHTGVISVLVEQHQLAQAKIEFERLKKQAPGHPETLFLQAQFAFADNDYRAAREICDVLLAAAPDAVRVLLLAGAAEHRMQHYTLAEGLLGRALKLEPELLPTRHLLAQNFMRDARPEKAVEVLRPLIEGSRADAVSLALAGQAYLQAGDDKRSEAAFQRARQVAPEDVKVRTSLALAQLSRGNNASAMTQLEAIAQSDGGSSADLALVSARMQQSDHQGALRAIAGLEKKQPAQALPLVLRARVLSRQGDLEAAAASYRQALVKEPRYFPATAGLASLDIRAGKPQQARDRFQALIKADPKHLQARLALAELDGRLGAPAATLIAQYTDAVKADPTQSESHLALIESLLSAGDGAGAMAAAQQAAAALPNDVVLMDALGRAQLAAGDRQQAVSTLKRLASFKPKDPLPQVRLADAHRANQDRGAASVALKQALAIEPDNLLAQRGLALLAAEEQRPAEGLTLARAMQQRLPKEAVGFALEGELEAGGRNWAAAARAYRLALQRDPSSDLAARLHGTLVAGASGAEADRFAADWLKSKPADAAFMLYLGDKAAAAKDWGRAEAHYRAVHALQPQHAGALNNIAWLLATQRKVGGVVMAEKANALSPGRSDLLDTWAFALESENQLPKAVETQRKAVAIDPKEPMLRLRLARLLAKQGDKSAARKELEILAQLGDRFAGQSEAQALRKEMQ